MTRNNKQPSSQSYRDYRQSRSTPPGVNRQFSDREFIERARQLGREAGQNRPSSEQSRSNQD